MDIHGCPACPHPAIGPAIQGSPNVNVNKRPALRVDDSGIHAACCGANTWTATKGSETVFINGKVAHRMGDQNRHCGGMGQLVEGSPNVIVGDSGGGDVCSGGVGVGTGGGLGRSSGGGRNESDRAVGTGAAERNGVGGACVGGNGRDWDGGGNGRAIATNGSWPGNAAFGDPPYPTDFEVVPASLTLSVDGSAILHASEIQSVGRGAGTYTWRTSSTKLSLDGALSSPQLASGITLTVLAGSAPATGELVSVTRTQAGCPPITKQVRIAIVCERFRLGPAIE